MDVSIALDIRFTPVGVQNTVSESQEKLQGSFDIMAPKKSAFFFKSETRVKSPIRKFKEKTLDLAINRLIYGCRVSKLNKYSMYHLMIFYINEENIRYLQWIPVKKSGDPSSLDLLKIKLVHDSSDKEVSQQHSCKINKLLYILYANDKAKKLKLTLKFPDSRSKEMFWQGLLHFMSQASTVSQFRTHHEMLASTFLKKEQGKNMDLKSLRTFLKNRHIFVEIEELKVVFSKIGIDANSSFMLTKALLRQILRELLNDNGFLEIFSNYCESWLDEKNEKTEHYMTISELRRFFVIEQGEEVDDESLKEIIATYDDKQRETNSTEFISLSGFRNILCSKNNEFFDPNKLVVYQNMNRPLTDYFIKSSHNTYLSSNQLIGNSSVEAYINALSHGYRCIELDCWDGEKGEPVIYHGYTLTSKISFNEVMRCIVDFGFIKNPYPIILSIENHCNKNQQKLMANIIKDTCGDLLYYLPENHQELDFFPSPEDLRRKILIKTKIPVLKKTKSTEPGSAAGSTMNSRMSVFFKSSKQENKTNTSSFTKTLEISPNLMFNKPLTKDSKSKGISTTTDLFDETIVQQTVDNSIEYTEQKNKNIDMASEVGILGHNISFTKVKSISLLKSLVVHQKTFSLKHDFNTISERVEENQKSPVDSLHENLSNNFSYSPINQEETKWQNVLQMKTHSDNIITSKSPKVMIETLSSKDIEHHHTHSHRSNHTHHLSIQTSIEKGERFEKHTFNFNFNFEVDFNKMHVQFLKNISLLGVKMSFMDPLRSVFTISSLNEARISKFLAESETKIINFHRKYLSRTYPSGTRIDSSNYDPIPAFLAGAQMVALNIQTCDLFLLLYEALFRENGGLNCGYVLKPKFLRREEKAVTSELRKVKKIVRINIISVQGISSILKNSNSGYYVEISLRGSKQDENENKIYRSETIKKKGGNGKFSLKTEFSARCPKICFFLIQLFGKNDLMSDERLGWCCVTCKLIRKGYRRIPLFNNKFNEIDSCFLFGHVELDKKEK